MRVCLIVFFILAGTIHPVDAKTLKAGVTKASKFRSAEVIEGPSPKIPTKMQESCFKSFCIARFFIDADGKHTVKLLTSSGSEHFDEKIMTTLRSWKFGAATLNGEAVKCTRKVKIVFEVQ